jgi:hypothetical protein
MGALNKIRRALRGEVRLSTVAFEALRRVRVSVQSRRERAYLKQVVDRSPKLAARFQLTFAEDLVTHFRERKQSLCLAPFTNAATAELQRDHFPRETRALVLSANKIVDEHSWPLLGFGERDFGHPIEWLRDPLSGHVWELDYHREIGLFRSDGSDARVLWELNRLGHLVTLGRAYKVTGDERFSLEFFAQLEHWSKQNPVGFGPNWTCAMEVALRAINLLAAFEFFRNSEHLTLTRLELLLSLLEKHGEHISRNLEFSYIATSNHYLTDVVGLLWLGVLLPELVVSRQWKSFGLREMLREMDKQILPDGADFESSTGYHRYILELLLYSFILCRENHIQIEQKYWNKLRQMLRYTASYLRPDGCAPLIGDSDSGQVLPLQRRRADDHAYLLGIGAVVFNDASLKVPHSTASEELLWLLGHKAVNEFERMHAGAPAESVAFADAGTYIMRHDHLYLCFNTNGAGINGRGSHGHNDALSIELSAHGRAFIVDPGSYIYTGDLEERHRFRSTAFHSTVEIDQTDQSTTQKSMPFVIGNEARPETVLWETAAQLDRVVARHFGYGRLIHQRSVAFYKNEARWVLEDEFFGEGEHDFAVRFHLAPGLEVRSDEDVVVLDPETGMGIRIHAATLELRPVIESQPVSRDYGELTESVSVCWRYRGQPIKMIWEIETAETQR